jgi:4-amino-4-deoxy-L-arabinose transferase-like glycosyltransferase
VSRKALALTAILALAFGVRVWFVREVHPPELYVVHDMAFYERNALRLLEGVQEPEDTFNPIGYPAFLALVYRIAGPSPRTVGMLQAALGTATCAVAWALARRTCRTRLAAPLAALSCALYFPLIFYAGFLLTETVFAFLASAGVLLWIRAVERPRRGGRWLLAGVVLGLATTVRTNFLLVVPFLAFAAWPRLRRAARLRGRAAWAALGLALVLGPAAARNSWILRRPAGLSTNAGLNFYLGQARVRAVRFPEGDPIEAGSVAFGRKHYQEEFRTDRHAWDDRYFFRLGLEALAEHPQRLLDPSNLREGLGIAAPLPYPQHPFWPGWMGHDAEIAASSLAFPTLFLPGLALAIGARPTPRRSVARRALLATLVAVLFTMHFLKGDARVRLSFDPLLLPLAVAGWEAGARRLALRLRRWRGPRAG